MAALTLRPATRLSNALALGPQVLDYIVSLNPHEFERLRNPYMRRLMSPRITLERVAAMVHMPVDELLEHVGALTGSPVAHSEAQAALPHSPRVAPTWVRAADPASVRVVDLLQHDVKLDLDPMTAVMPVVKGLPPGGVCLIKHRWEPQPFYDVWSKMGSLEWFAEQVRADEWHVWVRRTSP
jgi:hypothetical protein